MRQLDEELEVEGQRRAADQPRVKTAAFLFYGLVLLAMVTFQTVFCGVLLSEYNAVKPQVKTVFDDFRATLNTTQNILPFLERVNWTALRETAQELTGVENKVGKVLVNVDVVLSTIETLKRKYPQFFDGDQSGNATTSTIAPTTSV